MESKLNMFDECKAKFFQTFKVIKIIFFLNLKNSYLVEFFFLFVDIMYVLVTSSIF